MPLRGVMPMPPAKRTADLVVGLEGRKGTLVGRVREPHRVLEVRPRGTCRERHRARVHALLGRQLEERELSWTECEVLRFLHLNRVRGRRKGSRGHDPDPETPRRPVQPCDLPFALGAGTRPPYFVAPTRTKALPRGGDSAETWPGSFGRPLHRR